MQPRGGIRDWHQATPDCAALHPGYVLPWLVETYKHLAPMIDNLYASQELDF
jgi:hypothetical protein